MICAKTVFKCFKTLERWGNVITGAAGPYFVGLAVILITLGVVCFFDVIAPDLSYPIITIPICILIALNLLTHYYYVVTVSPGFVDDPPREPGTGILWARKGTKKGKQRVLTGGVRWSTRGVKITPASHTKCWKCKKTRPEKWDHHVPEIMFAMIYILSIVLCFAVGVMLSYHLYGISWGETTVEAQDHDEYRKKAKARNEDFVNSYDLGKKENLAFFFNLGESGYSRLTLFVPLRINPYTDGFSWARRDGYEKHQGVRQGEELTDEEDEDDV
ncbi:hypothetical protein CVT25_003690 [Psilocybe cyanescens]|uniref:Uncharacterized protein n=1 Tax=Psilocybe cyanescens TaxID=93625 RepID=A0A409WP71_PSICY|nr:hypothetical protein CVT25_003690 [Psilocybe cyanescens]